MREMKDSGVKWVGEIPSSFIITFNPYLRIKKGCRD